MNCRARFKLAEDHRLWQRPATQLKSIFYGSQFECVHFTTILWKLAVDQYRRRAVPPGKAPTTVFPSSGKLDPVVTASAQIQLRHCHPNEFL
jgi:hypothetical protein